MAAMLPGSAAAVILLTTAIIDSFLTKIYRHTAENRRRFSIL